MTTATNTDAKDGTLLHRLEKLFPSDDLNDNDLKIIEWYQDLCPVGQWAQLSGHLEVILLYTVLLCGPKKVRKFTESVLARAENKVLAETLEEKDREILKLTSEVQQLITRLNGG